MCQCLVSNCFAPRRHSTAHGWLRALKAKLIAFISFDFLGVFNVTSVIAYGKSAICCSSRWCFRLAD